MLREKGTGLYRDEPYKDFFSYIYGKKEVKPAAVAPVAGAPAPVNLPVVPAARAGREVSSILGSDPFGNDIILSGKVRERALYLLGVSGAGKTTMLLNLILQHIQNKEGVCVLDPHGDLTKDIIACMPVARRKDVILLDLANEAYAFGLNLYQCDNPTNKAAVQDTVERIMHVWDRLFHINRLTVQMVQFMRKCAQTIVPNPGYTMAEIPLLFDDIPFRNKLLLNVADINVHRFWKNYDEDTKTDQMRDKSSILNKLDEFLLPTVLDVIGQAKSTINMREIMDASPGKILLVKLNPKLDGVTSLVGSMIIALVRAAAFSRDVIPEQDRKDFFVYADEFDRFATLDFKNIIDEARKFHVFPVMAHQTRDVLHREVPGLVRSTLGGNLVVFIGCTAVDTAEMAVNYDTSPPEPEMEEIGRVAKLTYKQDVVGKLLHDGHSNPVVNTFVNTTLRKLSNMDKVQGTLSVDLINTIFYEAMRTENPNTFFSFSIFERGDIEFLLSTAGCGNFGSLFHYTLVGPDKKNFDMLYTLWINPIGSQDYFDALTYFKRKARPSKDNWRYKMPNAHEYALLDDRQEEDFEKLFIGLKQVVEGLVKEPIWAETGEYEIKYRVGQQLSSAEMAARIGNMLSSKPNYKAYARVGGDIQYCWNCGVKSASFNEICQSCQARLKNEYTVSAAPVQKDESVSVDAIIAEIVQQNVEDKYLRLRSDVEREILERQQPPEKQETAAAEKPRQNKPAVVAPGAGVLVPGASRRKVKKGE